VPDQKELPMNAMKSRFSRWLCAFFFAAVATGAVAQETPAVLEGATVVDAARVQQMMRSGTPVYDVRVAAEYAEAHIKGAQSLPYREKSAKAIGFDKAQDSFDLNKLPADKNAAFIFYCNAGDCWKSYKASRLAIEAGYKRVHWFRGGLPEWRTKKMPVD
jgi:rhodanese-related sulfurtransferase